MQSTENNYWKEIEESGGFHSGAATTTTRLAMLTLNNPTTTAAAAAASANRCTVCGGSSSSTKRRSPSSSSSLQEPSAKKQLLTPPPPSRPTTTKPSPPNNSLPILRRCVSDPISSPGTTAAGPNLSATTPSQAKTTASLPPLPKVFRRSVSDPLSHSSPNSIDLGSESNRGGGERGSPSSKRLQRIRDRMREMINWWVQVVKESEEEDGGIEEISNGDGNRDEITEDECVEAETEEEAVSVEKTGDCLIIHFKCPCKKGYQILLSGKNCYYKLM